MKRVFGFSQLEKYIRKIESLKDIQDTAKAKYFRRRLPPAKAEGN